MPPERVVYTGGEIPARALCALLRERGLGASVLDEPNWLVRITSFGTYRYRVAVPEDSTDAAKAAVAEWHAFHDPRANALHARMRRVAAWALLPPAAWALLAFAAHPHLPKPSIGTALLAWVASLVVIARVEARRRRDLPGP